MRYISPLIIPLLFILLFSAGLLAEEGTDLFSGLESKKEFAEEISTLIESAWTKWQDSVTVKDVDVEGSRGQLSSGDMGRTVLTAKSIMSNFSRKGKSREYIECVRAISGALENGMRKWQRGYSHGNIPFPQGASSTYTLTPCTNVPVTVASGSSTGDRAMTEDELYNYMLYRAPKNEGDVLIVFRGFAKAISGCFNDWKKSCLISEITASGGIAPPPAPMGQGPGPVKGAKGKGGKLEGPYIDRSRICSRMVEYFEGEGK
ncbi:MAG: hypothetical protein HQ594_01190 [Candidatus Omnitrophica bacterium]|nr:hypothetical protein [Candidatus Omnitrophota bacterium]